MSALPPIVDQHTWRAALDDLRKREKAATRELDAIAAQRRRLPMVQLPEYTLVGADGPIRLADVFDGRSQLIVYNHMWTDGEEWQCPGMHRVHLTVHPAGFPGQLRRPLRHRHQRPDREALAYQQVGNKMDWYSSSDSPFAADVDAAPGDGFGVNVFLRDGDTVYRTWHTTAGAPNSSATRSPSSTCCRGAARRSGRTPLTVAAAADILRLGRFARHRAGLRRKPTLHT